MRKPSGKAYDQIEASANFEQLAQRCEASNGPDRDLDEAIMGTLFRRESRNIGCQEEQDDGSWTSVKDSVWVDPATDQWVGTGAREYTSSIDEAMTLANGLRGLALMQRSNPDMGGKDWLASAGSIRSAARSWALALCAVGLRNMARSHSR
jgi:hypothetical protein